MTITPAGTALISIYQINSIKEWGRTVWIWDCVFQEIDIATKDLVFEWRASDHHSLNETYSDIKEAGKDSHSPWDFYHLNSIQKDQHGNFFVSARYTHTLTYIDGKTGDVIWILGGKKNMFQDLSNGNATNFASQHMAELHELAEFPNLLGTEIERYENMPGKDDHREKLVSLFDNGADNRIHVRSYSRGLLLQISYPSPGSSRTKPPGAEVDEDYTVRLIHAYNHRDHIGADSQGSFQVLPATRLEQDPTIGVSYGQKAVLTEYSASGRIICDTHFAPRSTIDHGGPVQSYRILKFPWIGQPIERPRIALANDENTVFVSWNGATEVKNWTLQYTAQPRSTLMWVDVFSVRKQGFETRIKLGRSIEGYFRVAAVDKKGHILSVSESFGFGDQFEGLGEIKVCLPHCMILTFRGANHFVRSTARAQAQPTRPLSSRAWNSSAQRQHQHYHSSSSCSPSAPSPSQSQSTAVILNGSTGSRLELRDMRVWTIRSPYSP